ncbi:MAG: hypothetical protein IJN16_07565 [Lachnospiraceae bacterium]|nr:hypothetical protein [Lachnospiraceae bacterium]
MDYEIVIIEEEIIPLAGTINSNSQIFSGVGILLFLFMMILIFFVYSFHCERKRRRVALLTQRYQKEGYMGWNISRLNKEIMRLELEAVAEGEQIGELLQRHEPS